MEFIFGFFGAVTALALFAAGVWAGRRSRTVSAAAAAPAAAAEEEAFRCLQNYNARLAYGMGGDAP